MIDRDRTTTTAPDDAPSPRAAPAWRLRARQEWRRHRQEYAIAGVMAVALMSGYVHVLHRAVAEGPARQEAAFSTAATHDAEADRRAAESMPADDDRDPTRNRVFERLSLPHTSAVAATM